MLLLLPFFSQATPSPFLPVFTLNHYNFPFFLIYPALPPLPPSLPPLPPFHPSIPFPLCVRACEPSFFLGMIVGGGEENTPVLHRRSNCSLSSLPPPLFDSSHQHKKNRKAHTQGNDTRFTLKRGKEELQHYSKCQKR